MSGGVHEQQFAGLHISPAQLDVVAGGVGVQLELFAGEFLHAHALDDGHHICTQQTVGAAGVAGPQLDGVGALLGVGFLRAEAGGGGAIAKIPAVALAELAQVDEADEATGIVHAVEQAEVGHGGVGDIHSADEGGAAEAVGGGELHAIHAAGQVHQRVAGGVADAGGDGPMQAIGVEHIAEELHADGVAAALQREAEGGHRWHGAYQHLDVVEEDVVAVVVHVFKAQGQVAGAEEGAEVDRFAAPVVGAHGGEAGGLRGGGGQIGATFAVNLHPTVAAIARSVDVEGVVAVAVHRMGQGEAELEDTGGGGHNAGRFEEVARTAVAVVEVVHVHRAVTHGATVGEVDGPAHAVVGVHGDQLCAVEVVGFEVLQQGAVDQSAAVDGHGFLVVEGIDFGDAGVEHHLKAEGGVVHAYRHGEQRQLDGVGIVGVQETAPRHAGEGLVANAVEDGGGSHGRITQVDEADRGLDGVAAEDGLGLHHGLGAEVVVAIIRSGRHVVLAHQIVEGGFEVHQAVAKGIVFARGAEVGSAIINRAEDVAARQVREGFFQQQHSAGHVGCGHGGAGEVGIAVGAASRAYIGTGGHHFGLDEEFVAGIDADGGTATAAVGDGKTSHSALDVAR